MNCCGRVQPCVPCTGWHGGRAVRHYAALCPPCDSAKGAGFRVAVVLPRGTNTEKPDGTGALHEDKLLWARNKWLIAHPDTNEAKQGAFVGLEGENPDIAPLI